MLKQNKSFRLYLFFLFRVFFIVVIYESYNLIVRYTTVRTTTVGMFNTHPPTPHRRRGFFAFFYEPTRRRPQAKAYREGLHISHYRYQKESKRVEQYWGGWLSGTLHSRSLPKYF
jgi:hypothetical protein